MMSSGNPYETRLRRILEMVEQNGLAGLVTMPGPGLRYLTGAEMEASERLTLGLFAPGKPPILVVPAFEVQRTRGNLALEAQVTGYADEQGPKPVLAQACRDLGFTGRRVAAEGMQMRLMEFWSLRDVADLEIVPGDEMLAELRMSKDSSELQAMREAIARTEQVLRDFTCELRPGRTERKLTGMLHFALIEASGGEGVSFSPIVGTGPNGAMPHHTPSDRILQRGDLVVVDCGIFYHGYVSDITRTFAIGAIDSEMRRVYEAVQGANQVGRRACKPAATAESVDLAARLIIEQAGYGELFNHRTGHGIGLEIHEPPYIVEGNSTPLEPGMTFTIEPGVYVAGVGGVRIEDDVVITEEGAETLTSFPRDLMIL